MLTDLPEYKSALRLANAEGNDFLDAAGLQKFLTEEQGFKGIDVKKAEAIIEFSEPQKQQQQQEKKEESSKSTEKVLTISGESIQNI